MNNSEDETQSIKKKITQNKMVKYIEDESYEPLILNIYHKRKKRLNYWLRYVGLALIFEMMGVLLDVYAKSDATTYGLREHSLEIAATISSAVALVLVLVAFVYLLSARRSKIMKDIRAHELL